MTENVLLKVSKPDCLSSTLKETINQSMVHYNWCLTCPDSG